MRIEVLSGRQITDSGLAERIIEFDKLNMQPVLQKAGVVFPEKKRREGLSSDPTLIVAFDDDMIAGYLEHLRSWRDPNYIYVASVQIARKHRNTGLLLELLDKFKSTVSGESLVGFETNVQKTNSLAVRLCRKIGFELQENPDNKASWLARADKDLLETSAIVPLIIRRRERSR